MTTKEYLSQVERLDRMIQNKLEDIYKFKTMVTSITVGQKDVNVQTSGDKDKLGCMMAKIIDMETNVDRMVDKRSGIIEQIGDIADIKLYEVLIDRYVKGKDLKVIAIERGFSERHVNRLHGEALQAFEKKFGKEYMS